MSCRASRHHRRGDGDVSAYNDNDYDHARHDEHDDRSVQSDACDRCDASELFAAAHWSLDQAARHHRCARSPGRARGCTRYEAASQAHDMTDDRWKESDDIHLVRPRP